MCIVDTVTVIVCSIYFNQLQKSKQTSFFLFLNSFIASGLHKIHPHKMCQRYEHGVCEAIIR